jgi:hypothetical protein
VNQYCINFLYKKIEFFIRAYLVSSTCKTQNTKKKHITLEVLHANPMRYKATLHIYLFSSVRTNLQIIIFHIDIHPPITNDDTNPLRNQLVPYNEETNPLMNQLDENEDTNPLKNQLVENNEDTNPPRHQPIADYEETNPL